MKAVVLSETSISSYCLTSCNISEDLNPYHCCQTSGVGCLLCFWSALPRSAVRVRHERGNVLPYRSPSVYNNLYHKLWLPIIFTSNAINNPMPLVNKQMPYSIRVVTEHFLSSSGEINLSDQWYHFTQAMQSWRRWPIFHSAVSQGLCSLFQCVALNIRLLATVLKVFALCSLRVKFLDVKRANGKRVATAVEKSNVSIIWILLLAAVCNEFETERKEVVVTDLRHSRNLLRGIE